MKIIPLSEGAFTVDQTKVFRSFNPAGDNLQSRPSGSLLVEIQPFLVITSYDIILIDTGLGFSVNNELQIHKTMKQHGINPSEVTKVLMSHLHKDHSGGISLSDGAGKPGLSFSGATYYVQQQELNYALHTASPSFVADKLSILSNNISVELIDGNGTIDGYIRFGVTGGHSPYHQVFWIEEDNEIVFFGGDVAPQLQQMKSRFIAKYDFDGRKCMELRRDWWQKGEQEGWKFLFYHDIKTPVWPALVV